MITIRINGVEVEAPRGSSVLEAARSIGVRIPTLCHLKGRTLFGACRLCVVELPHDAHATLAPACSLRVRHGLEVGTETARVARARRVIAELLLAFNPRSNEIRKLAESLGVTHHRFKQEDEARVPRLRLVPSDG